MSSDRRSRDDDRPRGRRIPSDRADRDHADSGQDRNQAQPRRRRTSYVPRQGSAQPRRFTPESPEDERTRHPGAPRRAQQPRYRQESRPPVDQYDAYDEPGDDAAHPSPSAPPRRNNRQSPASRQPRFELGEEDHYRSSRSRDTEYDDDYADQYDDSFINEDDWYEEEVTAGAARPRSTRTRGRTARRPTTPAISLPRLSLPRPTVPTSVREAAIVQDQNAIILSAGLLLSVLLLALFTSNRADTLAPGFSTHVSASGLQERFRSESALWQLPLMAGALFLMNGVLAWSMAQRSRFLSRFFLTSVTLVHVLIWVAFLRIAY